MLGFICFDFFVVAIVFRIPFHQFQLVSTFHIDLFLRSVNENFMRQQSHLVSLFYVETKYRNIEIEHQDQLISGSW